MSNHLRGISARSLEDVLSAVAAAQGDSAEVGRGLFGVVSTLDATPALRRVLTDPSTEADAKVGLAASVFGGKIAAGALDVVKAAVSARWAAGRDLADGLETAGVVAYVKAAGSGADAVETQLFEAGRVVASDPELRAIVSDRSVPTAPKLTLLARIFEGKLSVETLALVQQAAAARTGSFERVLASFGRIVAEQGQRAVAVVRVAYELGDDEKTRLAAALKAKYGRDVHLNIVIDPSVVGGIAVSLGAEVVDGTMSSRLEAARRQLAG